MAAIFNFVSGHVIKTETNGGTGGLKLQCSIFTPFLVIIS